MVYISYIYVGKQLAYVSWPIYTWDVCLRDVNLGFGSPIVGTLERVKEVHI